MIDVDADPLTVDLVAAEKNNKIAVDQLNRQSCCGDVFLESAPIFCKTNNEIAVTKPNTWERQDALAEAHYAGQYWFVTGGAELNSDDWFIAQTRKKREKEVSKLPKKKLIWEEAEKRKTNAKRVLNKVQNPYTDDNAVANLTVQDLKILYQWTHGILPKKELKKDDLISDWNNTKLNRPFDENAIAWGQQEEGELHRLETEMITIKDTKLWKQKKKMAQDLTAALNLMLKDDMNNYIEGGVLEELKSKLNDS